VKLDGENYYCTTIKLQFCFDLPFWNDQITVEFDLIIVGAIDGCFFGNS
jgi:hypothetical protein